MAIPQDEQPDQRLSSADVQREQASISRETRRPSDSVPMVSGTFANLPMRFGRYEVKRLLGRGAMGAVYLARDTQLERLVALKIPKVSASGSKRLSQRLQTEAKAAAQLDHPSLCKVHDAGEVDGQCFIAMQYIEGETLKSQLEKGEKTAQESVALILQLADGLLEAHNLRIVHRDLKPENIMMNRRGIPVIMDFGLAKFSTIHSNARATQAGTILGSPAYMSPEQASGTLEGIDQRSDIYSLGVVFFELLTGKLPFEGTAMQILGQKSILEPISPLSVKPDLSPTLAAICHKMIAKSNIDRYQALDEVIVSLKAIDFNMPSMVFDGPEVQLNPSIFTHPRFQLDPFEEPSGAPAAPNKTKSARLIEKLRVKLTSRHQQFRIWWTALSAAGALLVALGIILFYPTPHGTLQIDIEDPSLQVRFDGTAIIVANDGKPIRVTPTVRHTFEVMVDGTTIESPINEVTLKKDEKLRLTVKLIEGKVVINEGQSSKVGPSGVAIVNNNTTQQVPNGAGSRVQQGIEKALKLESSAHQTAAPAPDSDPIPLSSHWTGLLLTQFEPGKNRGVEASAIVTKRSIDRFTIRITVINVNGPFHWEYDCLGKDGVYQITKAKLSESNFNEADGEKSIEEHSIALGDRTMTIQLSRPSSDGARQQLYRLERDSTELSANRKNEDASQFGLKNGHFTFGYNNWKRENGGEKFTIFKDSLDELLLSTFGSDREASTGRVSQSFNVPLDADTLSFGVSGGNWPQVYVSLEHDGSTYKRTSASNDNKPTYIYWDLKPLRGKRVTLEMVDETSEAWGFIAIREVEILCERHLSRTNREAADSDLSSQNRSDDKEANRTAGIAHLRQVLVNHSWNCVDSLYPPGGPVRFHSNGKFNDDWKFNYWVVGPNTMHVQFWDADYAPNKSVLFTFNDDLTGFAADFDRHHVTGTRLNPIQLSP